MARLPRTISLLILIMTSVAVLVGGIAIAVLYREAIELRKQEAEIVAGLGLIAICLGTILIIRASRTLTYRLQQSENRFSTLLQASPVGVLETDAKGRCTFVNERWCEIAGITLDAARDEGWAKAIHPADAARIWSEWTEAANNNLPFRSEYRFQTGNDKPIWVYGQAAAIRDETGHLTGYVGTITDITERKAAEDALRQSEASLETAQRIAHIGNWAWDMESGGMEWSDEVYRIFGHAPQEFPATYAACLEHIHPDDRRFVTAELEQALDGAKPYNVDYRVALPDGRVIVVHEQGEVTFDDTGKPIKMLGTVQDVTQQKHYEAQLRELNESLEQRVDMRTKELVEERNFVSTTFETVGALIVVLDHTGRIERFNHACEQITGFTAAEVQGKYIWDVLIPPAEVASAKQAFSQLTTHGTSRTYENHLLTKKGEQRLIAWSNSSIQAADGTLTVIVTGIDITERKRAENEIFRAKEDAERANQAKSDFLARMSHELRTPMNAILGFSQMLELDGQNPLNPEQKESVQEILKAGWHLLELINEVLDISRIESGNMTFDTQPFSIAPIVEDAARLIGPLAKQQGIKMSTRMDPSEKLIVMADRTRLRQALVNLLSNAVKYNKPAGSVRISCEALSDRRARISITDTGYGIPPEKMSHLFIPFERLGAEFSATEGTGIRLVLSKRLVEMMGGTLEVGSTAGEGSTFWIEFPRAAEAEIEHAANAWVPLSETGQVDLDAKVKVLYVEDNLANLKLVKIFLGQRPDFVMFGAANGDIGLELARSHRPDVILLDINLPGMNGYQILAQLRTMPETRDIPVIALSADAMPHDVETGIAAGFFNYLTKPIDMNALLTSINLALKQ